MMGKEGNHDRDGLNFLRVYKPTILHFMVCIIVDFKCPSLILLITTLVIGAHCRYSHPPHGPHCSCTACTLYLCPWFQDLNMKTVLRENAFFVFCILSQVIEENRSLPSWSWVVSEKKKEKIK